LGWVICIDQTTTQGLFNLTFCNIDNVAWVCIRRGGKLVVLLLEIAMSEHAPKQGFFARWGQRITSLRNFVVNAGFLVLLVVVASALFSSPERAEINDDSALFISPMGVVVEQITPPADWRDLLFRSADAGLIDIGDLIEAIDMAADDSRIRLIVLNFDQVAGISSAQATRIGQALKAFRDQGKEVLAYTEYSGQMQYLTTSHADKIFLHPMGAVMLTGLGGDRLYFAEMLEKLKVEMHIFRVGDYKSATEPFSRNNMSPLARQDAQRLVDGLWQSITQTIASNRALSQADILDFANDYEIFLAAAQGNGAQATLDQNLVDGLMTASAFRDYVGELVGWQDQMLNGVDYQSYLMLRDGDIGPATAPEEAIVGVLTAQGPIVESGLSSSDAAVADELVEQIRMARDNADIKALVLRVDSPGGSAFASELIREELEAFQLTGRPVVASFGSVAASGGYWISATADAIFAEPTTITGSIGIFGLVPNFASSLDAIGVTADGVSSAPLARGLSVVSDLSPQAKNILQLSVDHGYREFLALVTRGRQLSLTDVETIAQGRIWSGVAAKEIGLADEIGGLNEALNHAADLAGLTEWSSQDLLPPLDPQSVFMMELMQATAIDPLGSDFLDIVTGSFAEPLPWQSHWFKALSEDLRKLNAFNDPRHVYAMCLACGAH
jgi:protease-4